ncbi:MAG TPA: DNA adenine methylase [Gemmatimonadaceae bacterium]|nr:DNA adenine methylase [Gemmatimonadaceae bacterium]
MTRAAAAGSAVPVRRTAPHLPPLRWAGSKRAVLPLFVDLVPARYRTYIEPFAGSASLFFRLAPRSAILGDINTELVLFYEVLATQPQALSRALSRLMRRKADYYDVRATEPSTLTSVNAAARFLYLNRKCFNGVYRTNRQGAFNVPEGHHTGAMPSFARLKAAADALRSAELYNADFEDTIARARAKDFVYLDPPYARRRSRRPGEYGYAAFDGGVDIERLSAGLAELDHRGAYFMLSYSRSPSLLRRIPWTWKRTIGVTRNVGGYRSSRRIAQEVVVGNYELP